jgi:fumarylacetoacetate (FAA) hydrolase
MKLGSLKTGGRDGRLVVVSRDLTRALPVAEIAPCLRDAIERWAAVEPRLREAAAALDAGSRDRAMALTPDMLAAPLPRAFQWLDASAFLNHVELVRKARGAEMPASFWTDPLMYQGGSDGFLGPSDPIEAVSEDWGIDFEAEIAVITDDVPLGVGAAAAARHIKLVMLVNDVSLRNLIPAELAKGFGFVHGKPASAFSPVAATLDELGGAWRDNKLCRPLLCSVNQTRFGAPNAGLDMTFDFAALIAHAAKTRALGAGTIIGSGTVSNRDRGVGSACIAEQRMLEIIADGKPRTPFLRFGDRVRIDMTDDLGDSIFGAIEQTVVRIASAAEAGG